MVVWGEAAFMLSGQKRMKDHQILKSVPHYYIRPIVDKPKNHTYARDEPSPLLLKPEGKGAPLHQNRERQR